MVLAPEPKEVTQVPSMQSILNQLGIFESTSTNVSPTGVLFLFILPASTLLIFQTSMNVAQKTPALFIPRAVTMKVAIFVPVTVDGQATGSQEVVLILTSATTQLTTAVVLRPIHTVRTTREATVACATLGFRKIHQAVLVQVNITEDVTIEKMFDTVYQSYITSDKFGYMLS